MAAVAIAAAQRAADTGYQLFAEAETVSMVKQNSASAWAAEQHLGMQLGAWHLKTLFQLVGCS